METGGEPGERVSNVSAPPRDLLPEPDATFDRQMALARPPLR